MIAMLRQIDGDKWVCETPYVATIIVPIPYLVPCRIFPQLGESR